MSTTLDILSNPAVRARLMPISVEQYHRLCDAEPAFEKTELIRGLVIDKMTITPDHSWLTEFLASWLRDNLGAGWLVRFGQPLTLADSEPEPDIAVVSGKMNDYRREHPKTAKLAIEVAVSSEAVDHAKAAVYAEAGVEEYWIVLANRQVVQVHLGPTADGYSETTLLGSGDTLRPTGFPALSLAVADLFDK